MIAANVSIMESKVNLLFLKGQNKNKEAFLPSPLSFFAVDTLPPPM